MVYHPLTDIDPAMSFWVLGVYVRWGDDAGSSYRRRHGDAW